MFHCLNEILELCHNFCSLVSQNVASLDERGAAQLDLLVKVKTPVLLIRLTGEIINMPLFQCCRVHVSGLWPAVFGAAEDPVQRQEPSNQLGSGQAAAATRLQQVLHTGRRHPGQVGHCRKYSPTQVTGPLSEQQLKLIILFGFFFFTVFESHELLSIVCACKYM